MTLLAAALALVSIGAGTAEAAGYAGCKLSLRDHDPPGGTSAYDLGVTRKNASCAVATRVMKAFHRCRTESRVGCPTRVLKSWRCSGRRDAVTPDGFTASFTCTAGRGRVRSTYRQNTPACFGAAARDPRLRCFNQSRSVSPKLGTLDPEQSWACNPDPVLSACLSGVEPEQATRHVALVGDSHSSHWRAALNFVAAIRQWRVYSHFAGGCFFSTSAHLFTEGCGDFYRATAGWFAQHPEVSTMFVTANADTPVGAPAGEDPADVKVDGFRRAFEELPTTVRHIIVLRDTPRSTTETLNCAYSAIESGTQRLAPLCPLERSVAIRPDLAVVAVQRLRSTRYQYVDLTPFMCGNASCYPVVGGTLVNGDQFGHLRMTFSRTLGPYLLRAVRRLEASW